MAPAWERIHNRRNPRGNRRCLAGKWGRATMGPRRMPGGLPGSARPQSETGGDMPEPAFNPENFWLANAVITRAAEEGESRIIDGIASTGNVDRMGTRIDQATLGKAMRRWHARGGKIFYNHNWSVAIGRSLEVHMREDGAHLRGEIMTGYPVPVASSTGMFGGDTVLMSVDDIWSMIRQGAASSYSVGFGGKPDPDDPMRILVDDLYEVSVVSIPANPDAEFAVTRAMDSFPWGQRLQPQRSAAGVWLLDGPQSGITISNNSFTTGSTGNGIAFEMAAEEDDDGQSAPDEWGAVMEELRKWRT